MEKLYVLILAAGEGKRMQSDLPKVLHKFCGQSMLEYVLLNALKLTKNIHIVVGHEAGLVQKSAGPGFTFVQQKEQRGTGHAVMQALPGLPDEGVLVILCGDVPLLTIEHLRAILELKKSSSCVVATADMPEPTGYGRMIKDKEGRVLAITEERDATAEEKKITEINTGTYCFDLALLKRYLPLVSNHNQQNEYYLTDVVELLAREGHSTKAFRLEDHRLGLGINNRIQLQEAAAIMQERIFHALMAGGVSIEDPRSTCIDFGVEVGKDTLIRPFCLLEKGTIIGSRAVIGPYAHLVKARVEDGALLEHCVVKEGKIYKGLKGS